MVHTPIHAPLGSSSQQPRPSTCHLIIAPLASTPCKHASPVPLACAPAPPYPRGLSPQPAATAARRVPLTEV